MRPLLAALHGGPARTVPAEGWLGDHFSRRHPDVSACAALEAEATPCYYRAHGLMARGDLYYIHKLAETILAYRGLQWRGGRF